MTTNDLLDSFNHWCCVNGFDPKKIFQTEIRISVNDGLIKIRDARGEVLFSTSNFDTFFKCPIIQNVSQGKVSIQGMIDPVSFNLFDFSPTCWVRDYSGWHKAKFVKSRQHRGTLVFIVQCEDMDTLTTWNECVFKDPIKKELNTKIDDLEKQIADLTKKLKELITERDAV